MRRPAVIPGLLALGFLAAAPGVAAEPKAVLELFTSQGCSSSPKADELAAELARGQDVVVLTFPVDYWDYLGWKDTLGAAAHSARQRAYALTRGDRKVFTPQMVVNGVVAANGADRTSVEAAMRESGEPGALLAVPVSSREAGGQIEVELREAPHQGEVWLVAVASKRTVTIGTGENAHRTVTYTNVVRRMTRLGRFTGRAARFMVPRSEAMAADADDYLVLVQAGSGSMPGPILGVHDAVLHTR